MSNFFHFCKYYFLLVNILGFLEVFRGQYAADTVIYQQTKEANEEKLVGQIKSHPDTEIFFYPERQLIYNNDYRFYLPLVGEYKISIIMDPCRGNSPDCCMNIFGSPEYASLIVSGLESSRVQTFPVIADPEEIAENYNLIDEQRLLLASTYSRLTDDESVIDFECISKKVPHNYCEGRNYAFKRATQRPRCYDNNNTVQGLAPCYSSENNTLLGNKCTQVAYTSTVLIPQCKDNTDDHCGTFLEIHMKNGSPYHSENDVISSVRITTDSVDGFYTTNIPTTFMGDENKVICSFTEKKFRIGLEVYVDDKAPSCCCPDLWEDDISKNRKGQIFCPKGLPEGGPFARETETISDIINLDVLLLDYPFCPNDLTSNEDKLMYSDWDQYDRRNYLREAKPVVKRSNSYRGGDLHEDSEYPEGYPPGPCPYFNGCAVNKDCEADPINCKCKNTDERFSFIGRVGRITSIDNVAIPPTVDLSFNKGRTSYTFEQQHVKLEKSSISQYELWWVKRTPSEYVIHNKKPFNVTYPDCTFDVTNDRYFPFTMLDENEAIIKNSDAP